LAFVAGCGNATSTAAAAPTTITLVGGIQTEPQWWFPVIPAQYYSTSHVPYIVMMYPPLFQFSNNDTIDYADSIGSSITVSHHDTVYTIHLRSWRWSNGTPVTAADVVYDWQLIQASSNPNGPWLNGFAGIGGIPADWKSVVATGPHTLVVTTTHPVNPVWFEENGLTKLTPIPVSVWKHSSNLTTELKWLYQVGSRPLSPEYRVVDGPYRVTQFVQDEYWIMTANPAFSGHRASIRRILFDYETSDSAVYAGLRKGVFAMAELPPEYMAVRSQLTNYRIVKFPYAYSINFINPNENPANSSVGTLFTHLYVRQALQLGIDEPVIAEKLYHGAAAPDYSSVPPEPPNVWYDPHVPALTYNPARGLALMEAHGWKLVNGVLEKNGQKMAFTFIYESGNQTDTLIAELLKADWAKEGIDVTLVAEPFNQVVALFAPNAPKWALAWYGAGWYYGAADPFPIGGTLFECPTDGGINNGLGFCDPALDRLFHAAYQAGTLNDIRARLDAVQVAMAQEVPVLWLPEFAGFGNPTPYLVIAPWLHGVLKTYEGIAGYFQYQDWTTTAP
jgi:peptide/nickel transport system substrate-binding protein